MRCIKLRAYAKLNLSLDVTGVREDGYHLMDMINRSVSLSDSICITKTPDREFSIEADHPYIPTDSRNLIWKAATALSEHCGMDMPQVKVRLKKVIPTQAGLGGGSADAAATLIGLNLLLELGLSEDELCEIGLGVGADVPFCIKGGCARTTGIGEVMEHFRDRCRYKLVIVMPRRGHSTGEYFSRLDEGGPFIHPDTLMVKVNLSNGDLRNAFFGAGNIFEQAVPSEETQAIKDELNGMGAVYSAMTGTGAAVFGVFTSPKNAAAACIAMRKKKYGCWCSFPVDKGVEITEQHL